MDITSLTYGRPIGGDWFEGWSGGAKYRGASGQRTLADTSIDLMRTIGSPVFLGAIAGRDKSVAFERNKAWEAIRSQGSWIQNELAEEEKRKLARDRLAMEMQSGVGTFRAW